MSMIVDFLDEKDTWAIVPETVAAHFSGLTHINIYQMSEAPPERVSCLIVHKNPRTTQKEAIDLFTGYLKEYLSTLKIHS